MLDQHSNERRQFYMVDLDPEPHPLRRFVVITGMIAVLLLGSFFLLRTDETAEGTPPELDVTLTAELCHRITVPNAIAPLLAGAMPELIDSCENLLGD